MERYNMEKRIREVLESGSTKTRFDVESDVETLIHELSTYHAELEFQNDELRRIRNELEDSNRRYKNLFEDAPLGYALITRDGIVRRINRTFGDIVHKINSELVGRSFLSFITPECQDDFYFHVNEVFESSEIVELEMKILVGQKKRHIHLYSNQEIYMGERCLKMAMVDITKEKEQESEIQYLMHHDKLTGLYNRRYIEEAIERGKWKNYKLNMVYIDVNDLKFTNTLFGYEDGNKRLLAVARQLKDLSLDEDVLARWGDDEFIVLLQDRSYWETKQWISTLETQLRELEEFDYPLSIATGYCVIERFLGQIDEHILKAEKVMQCEKTDYHNIEKKRIADDLMRKLYRKTPWLKEHNAFVGKMAIEFAKYIHLSAEDIRKMRRVAKYKDVGEFLMDENMLNKTGQLLRPERDVIQTHPEIGFQLLKNMNDLEDIACEVLNHHERYDGSGYPSRIEGDRIPVIAQIIGMMDTYVGIQLERPYHEKRDDQETYRLFLDEKKQFDKNMVDTFIDFLKKEAKKG